MTDNEVAKQIRDALRALNDALKTAAEIGLTVQIDSVGHEVIGYPHLNRIYTATIERRTVVK
jgi:hypothetical protein